jgi:hypothetical protein
MGVVDSYPKDDLSLSQNVIPDVLRRRKATASDVVDSRVPIEDFE